MLILFQIKVLHRELIVTVYTPVVIKLWIGTNISHVHPREQALFEPSKRRITASLDRQRHRSADDFRVRVVKIAQTTFSRPDSLQVSHRFGEIAGVTPLRRNRCGKSQHEGKRYRP